MDNNDAKLILQVYRSGGEDASDPFFAEALEQARLDPALRTWFAEQQAKDDEPCGPFVPKHHGSLGIDDVEDQGSDEATEWDRIEKAIDALGNDGATWFRTEAHGDATSLSIGLRKGRYRTLPYVSLQIQLRSLCRRPAAQHAIPGCR